MRRLLPMLLVALALSAVAPKAVAEPPPQQTSMIGDAFRLVCEWWGIKPKIKSHRTYIGGDGTIKR